MLVLKRKLHESVYIGDIEVKVVLIKGGSVRLSIDAPKDVPVHRGEVRDRIQREGRPEK